AVSLAQGNKILGLIHTPDSTCVALLDFYSDNIITILKVDKNNTIDIEFNQYVESDNIHLSTLSYYLDDGGPRYFKLLKLKEPIGKKDIEHIETNDIKNWNSVKFKQGLKIQEPRVLQNRH
ncbi:hypothetical protein ACFSCX_13260, partial [Bacillus salitolerans]